ncbi:hypothetical protein RRG08_003231 [Elysia crispata]|uniref:Uncharacterized protein n=1 Tax=Elysia crispata TaxID=231223 RepID=A0AAE1B0Z8_9GAST|nr:hypothetical protein RRG08_003231 [Elysia crispata]
MSPTERNVQRGQQNHANVKEPFRLEHLISQFTIATKPICEINKIDIECPLRALYLALVAVRLPLPAVSNFVPLPLAHLWGARTPARVFVTRPSRRRPPIGREIPFTMPTLRTRPDVKL